MKKTFGILCALFLAGNLSGAPLTRTIVVFPFVNQSGRPDLAWMSEGFAVALSRRLSGSYRLVLGRRERNTACQDLGLSEEAPITLASMYRVAETLGVDWAVEGSFKVDSGKLKVEAQLLDVRNLKLSDAVTASGQMGDIVDLETQIAWRMLAQHDPDFTVGREEDFRKQFPEVRLDAFESYIRGLLAPDADARIKFLREADRRNPLDHRAAFELGLTYFAEKDYSESVLWLRKMTPADDHFLGSQFRLGVAEYLLGRDKEAEKDFLEVSRKLPLNEVYNNLGVVEYHSGQIERALVDFDRAHRGDATNAQFSFNRGVCLWSLKKYSEAAAALKNSIGEDDENPDAHFLLADTLKKLGDSAGAEKEQKWLAAHENSPAPAPHLTADYSPQPELVKNYDGRAYRLLEVTIRNTLEARLSLEPPAQHAAAHIERARKLIDEGNYSEAEQDLAEATALEPSNNEAHLLLAQVYEAEGRHSDAAAELETSVKLDNQPGAQLWLAQIYLSLGRLSLAEQHGEAALALEPSNQRAAQLVREIQEHSVASGSRP